MFQRVAKTFLSVIAMAASAIVGTARASEALQAGIAFVDITPPVPFRMSGYFQERLSTGTKDSLQARAIVFRQGEVSAALVFCDLIGVPLEISAAARRRAYETTGIPAEQIAIAGTHTHTGPLFFMSLHDELHRRAVTKYGHDPHDSERYRRQLVEKIVESIQRAQGSLEEVELRSGTAHEDRISFNRRFYMRDGSVKFNPPIHSPDILRPAGPIDPQVGIISLAAPGEEGPTSAIVSFAMHLDTTGGTLYSADYVKSLEDRLQESLGSNFRLLFGTGTCGNINHRDVRQTKQRQADELGRMLGDSVVTAIERGAVVRRSAPSLAIKSAKVRAPLQSYSAEQISEAKAAMSRVGSREMPFAEAVEACKIMDIERLKAEGHPGYLEVQAIRLNRETALVLLPNEVFVETGLAIKAASPFKVTLVMELANDDLAYMPTRQAFQEGSYEVINSRVVPGSAERIVDAAVALVKELQ